MRLTKRPLSYWVLKKFRGLQLVLLGVIVISLFFRVFPLEMQRKIINEAINLKMIDKLYLYCALYMGAVLIAGLLKYFTNTMQAVLGQKLLILMRQDLYQHILQMPLTFFHRTQTGTVISAMTAELNAIATFLGTAVSVPITSVLTFAAFLGFMIYLNPMLGLISAIIYPLELSIIPILQNKYNKYNRKRVATTRTMASLVNEAISGIHEVQGNASYLLEQEKLDRQSYRLFKIINRLSLLKYGIKFSNNLFQSIGPFLLFLIGGYFAIRGQFTIGALVAFLSAYEKVYDPWKEVIEYYQAYQDSRVRYKQIMKLFDIEPIILLPPPKSETARLLGDIEARDISYQVNESVVLLSDISFTIRSGQHLALVGYSGSGKSTLSLLLSQLYKASSGTLTIGGKNVDELNSLDIARNISNVAQQPFIFTGTVRDNLLYSCNTLYLNNLKDSMPEGRELLDIVREVGLDTDVIRWGLRTVIAPERAKPMIPRFLKMRQVIQDRLKQEFSSTIEFYHTDKFLYYSSIATNIIFGSFGREYKEEHILEHKTFMSFLHDFKAEPVLVELGLEIARSTIGLLGEFKNDDFFFQRSPMNSDNFPDYESLCRKAEKVPLKAIKKEERNLLLMLALDFIPGLHKIHTITDEFEEQILSFRKIFLEKIGKIDLEQCRNGTIQTVIAPFSDADSTLISETGYKPFCNNQYLDSLSMVDNILFGTVIDTDAVRTKLSRIALEEFERLGLLDNIMEIGLDFHVGSKGDNLSGGQKQKIALARAFLKQSPILILDEATASLDNSSQARIQNFIETKLHGNTTVIAVVHRLDMISGYDHIVVMKDGKIVESGDYQDLMEKKGNLYDLVNSRQ